MYINGHRPALSGQRRKGSAQRRRSHGWAHSWLGTQNQRTATVVGGGGGVRVSSCVHACVRDVFEIYDNDILPRLIIYPIICLKSVDVRRLQVVILALSPREMSQTDRILPRYILSRVRVSVRPRIFYTRKTENHSHRILRSALRR